MKAQYIAYDERSLALGTEEATVLGICDSLDEARAMYSGFPVAIYQYDVLKDRELTNERLVEIVREK